MSKGKVDKDDAVQEKVDINAMNAIIDMFRVRMKVMPCHRIEEWAV